MSHANFAKSTVRPSRLADTLRTLQGEHVNLCRESTDGRTFRIDRPRKFRPVVAFPENRETAVEPNDPVVEPESVESLIRIGPVDEPSRRFEVDLEIETPERGKDVSANPSEAIAALAGELTGLKTTRTAFLEQSRELVEHLQTKERQLAEQDADFHVRVWNWERAAADQQQELNNRGTHLDQREQNLRALQFELLELQNELIDSKLAIRAIVSELEMPVESSEKMQALKKLKSELTERFEQTSKTWRRLYHQMNEIASQMANRLQDAA